MSDLVTGIFLWVFLMAYTTLVQQPVEERFGTIALSLKIIGCGCGAIAIVVMAGG